MKIPIIIASLQSVLCVYAVIRGTASVQGYIAFAITTMIYAWAFALACLTAYKWKDIAQGK